MFAAVVVRAVLLAGTALIQVTSPMVPRAVATVAPSAPSPEVTLHLDVAPGGTSWKVRLENGGSVPLKVRADGRLLSLTVQAPSTPVPLRCALPEVMRTTQDPERMTLVVPPHGAWMAEIDPRLFCFGAKELGYLIAGATVTARLEAPGWTPAWPTVLPRGKGPVRPAAVEGLEGVTPAVAALSVVEAPAVTLDTSSAVPLPALEVPPARTGTSKAGAADAGAATDDDDDDDDPEPPGSSPQVTLEVPSHVDARDGEALTITATLRNAGTAPARVRLRPSAFQLDVTGPTGVTSCRGPRTGPPAPELMTTLAPGQATSLSVTTSSLCPATVFQRAGLYTVRARLDARSVLEPGAGREVGTISATKPLFVRVQRGRAAADPERPTLASL